MLDGKQLTSRNSVLDRWVGLRDSSNCWWNMHLFRLLFDLSLACSHSGVLISERLQLAQKTWRDVTSRDSIWWLFSAWSVFFLIKGHKQSFILINVDWNHSFHALNDGLHVRALRVFDLHMVQQNTGNLSCIWDCGKQRRVGQNKCTHSLSLPLSLWVRPLR